MSVGPTYGLGLGLCLVQTQSCKDKVLQVHGKKRGDGSSFHFYHFLSVGWTVNVGLFFDAQRKGIEFDLLQHGVESVGTGGRKMFLQSDLVQEINRCVYDILWGFIGEDIN